MRKLVENAEKSKSKRVCVSVGPENPLKSIPGIVLLGIM